MVAYAIGELDQRVQLQRKSAARDGAGGGTATWTTYATVWALVRPLTGRERENAQRAEAVANYLVVIRQRTDLKESHRVLWGERALNIRFRKQRGRSAWLEMEAELGAAS